MAAPSPNTQKQLSERLWWVERACAGLRLCIGDSVAYQAQIDETGDPLAYVVTIALAAPVAKGTRDPLRWYFRWWAGQGDCHVPRILITDHHIRAEVLIKHRRQKGRLLDAYLKSRSGAG